MTCGAAVPAVPPIVPGPPPMMGPFVTNSYATCGMVSGNLSCSGFNVNKVLANPNFSDPQPTDSLTPRNSASCPKPTQGLPAGAPDKMWTSASTPQICADYSGTIWCWGSNADNSISPFGAPVRDGDYGVRATPEQIGFSNVVDMTLSLGGDYSCVVFKNGAARCWGDGLEGNLGTGEAPMPGPGQIYPSHNTSPTYVLGFGPGKGVTKIRAGGRHTCLLAGDAVSCWGRQLEGALGNGTPADGSSQGSPPGQNLRTNTPVTPTGLGPGSGSTDIALGANHSCAVVKGGVKCWGANTVKQAGQPSPSYILTPQWVSGLGANSGVTRVFAGSSTTCALVNGGVQCWGSNFTGNLGLNRNVYPYSAVPVVIPMVDTGVTFFSMSETNACAEKDGRTYCWGWGGFNALGDNNPPNQARIATTPVVVGCPDVNPVTPPPPPVTPPVVSSCSP